MELTLGLNKRSDQIMTSQILCIWAEGKKVEDRNFKALLISSIYIYIYIFFFLGLQVQHMEVSRLGVKSELQLLAYIATAMHDLSYVYNLHHSSLQRQILHPLSEARD